MGQGEVNSDRPQTLLEPAALHLILGYLRCLPVCLFINQSEGGSGRVGGNHGFWVLQAAGLRAGLPMGKAQSDTATAGWGLGVLGTQGGSCPRSHSFGYREISVASLFSSLSAFLACVAVRSQAQQKPHTAGVQVGKGDLGGGTLVAFE